MADVVEIALTVIGGAVGGLAVAFFKPRWDDSAAKNREERDEARKIAAAQRDRRILALQKLSDAARAGSAPHDYLRTLAAEVGDPTLVAAVGRYITAHNPSPERSDAQGDIAHLTGDLLRTA